MEHPVNLEVLFASEAVVLVGSGLQIRGVLNSHKLGM
jgi:hypothetical protein